MSKNLFNYLKASIASTSPIMTWNETRYKLSGINLPNAVMEKSRMIPV